jgi:hypothetical protein
MAVLIEQQDGCLVHAADTRGFTCRRSRGSERPFLMRGITALWGIAVSVLVFERLAQLLAMKCQDLVPDIVNQFEYGESLFGRPEAGDFDGDRIRASGR